ncbi:MAG: hypothetical protein HRU03_01415 [Nanoarchaeales archaeon]|nr:hypothetical protein [Nanoarchaeales archaeon]
MIKKISQLLFVSLLLVASGYSESNGVWHDAKDVRAGVFGSDEVTSGFIFENQLTINSFSNLVNSQLNFKSLNVNYWSIGKTATSNDFIINKEGSTNTFTILSNENIGIGTNAPTEKLHVIGNTILLETNTDSSSFLKLNSGATTSQSSGIELLDRGISMWTIGKDSSNTFRIDDSLGNNKFSINNLGNTGFGILNPTEKLDVLGNIKSTGTISSVTLNTNTITSANPFITISKPINTNTISNTGNINTDSVSTTSITTNAITTNEITTNIIKSNIGQNVIIQLG